ncbi:MAG: molybdenum cofactor guanylyltransferase [Pyrinomonadaceae bacterium]
MKIDAFVLIGGKSSRFGTDKATIIFDEKSLAERTATTIQKALSPVRITFVAANKNQPAAQITSGLGFKVMYDTDENRGPLGAVCTALAHAQTEWALVLACDLPFISVELLQRLAGFVSDETDAVTPMQSDGKMQSLCSLYRTKPCAAAMRNLLETDQSTPIRQVFENVQTRFVAFDELNDLPNASNFFLNVNTPEDFQTATAILASK